MPPRSALILIGLALGVGGWLRLDDLGGQVVVSDECHGVHAALRHDVAYLNSHYHEADYSIPMAIWNRWRIQSGGLGEWALRAPAIVPGLLLLPLTGAIAWRCFGPVVGVIAVWLTALSPLLVMYSRFARPYGAVAFLVLAALASMQLSLGRGGWRWAALAGLCGGASVYFNLSAGPAVLAIWTMGVVGVLSQRWRVDGTAGGAVAHPRWTRAAAGLAAPLLGTGTAWVLLAPAGSALLELVRSKSGSAAEVAFWDGWSALAGSQIDLVAGLLVVVICIGAVVGLRRGALFTLAALGAAAACIAAVAYLRPQGVDKAIAAARYCIAALPGLLVLAALGLERVGDWCARLGGPRTGPLIRGGVIALAVAGLFAAGPLPRVYSTPNAYRSHSAYYAAVDLPWPLNLDDLSVAYRFLRDEGADLAIVEAPWTRAWAFTPYGHYQTLHGRAIRVVAVGPPLADPRLALRSVILAPGGRLPSVDFDLLIVHKNIVMERRRVTKLTLPPGPPTLEVRSGRYVTSARSIIAQARKDRRLAPVFEDRDVVVFAASEQAAALKSRLARYVAPDAPAGP